MRPLLVFALLLGTFAYWTGTIQASQSAPEEFSRASRRTADTNGSIQVNGVTRNFVYAVSTYAAPAAGRPLVIHLHGDGGNMDLSTAWTSAVLNDANGAVLLSAQGRNNTAGCAQWLFNSSNPDC